MTSDKNESPQNYRAVETGIHRDFSEAMSYSDYLCLDQLLSAQQPKTGQHDEMLFISIHQASEIWIKLAVHELQAAMHLIGEHDFGAAFKVISRIKQIFNQLTQSWNILSTLTPVDYLRFRDALGQSSGFQSYGYRKLEFLLGNKNREIAEVHKDRPQVYEDLLHTLEAPGLYDIVLQQLAAAGFAIDTAVLQRDYSQAWPGSESVLQAWSRVYRNSEAHFDFYELAEKLVDIEEAVQQWRFKHMYTVQRIIGHKHGTGGSSGVSFLKQALEVSFFPELLEVRTTL